MAAIEGVDIHAHGVPARFLEEVKKTGLGGAKVEVSEGRYVLTFPGMAPLRPVAGVMLEFEQRLKWLDDQGMRHQIVAPWLDVDGQELPRADGQEWARQLNDALAQAVAATGGRLRAHATLHMADEKAAARELERCAKQLGMTACMVRTHLPQGELHEERYNAVWEAAQSLGVPIVLHPPTDGPSTCMFEALPKFRGLFGRLIDTTVVAMQLINAGVLDRHPDLRLVLVHGGGFLPYQTGRMDREAEKGKLPSDTVKRFYYDTTLMSPVALKLLFEFIGAGRVMIGSDYGAAAKERGGIKLTDALDATGVDAATRRKVVRENAETLFRI
jgi:aminocarboxymuconate-semialdehyde decarboxylase